MGCQISGVVLANAASACTGKSMASVVTGGRQGCNGVLHPKNQNILFDIGLWLHDTGHLYDTSILQCLGLISSKPD